MQTIRNSIIAAGVMASTSAIGLMGIVSLSHLHDGAGADPRTSNMELGSVVLRAMHYRNGLIVSAVVTHAGGYGCRLGDRGGDFAEACAPGRNSQAATALESGVRLLTSDDFNLVIVQNHDNFQ